jgi:hypothetical protein
MLGRERVEIDELATHTTCQRVRFRLKAALPERGMLVPWSRTTLPLRATQPSQRWLALKQTQLAHQRTMLLPKKLSHLTAGPIPRGVIDGIG